MKAVSYTHLHNFHTINLTASWPLTIYLPAFWLMANDENVYGQWPRCGEIDCMEVMGQDTKKLYGTIHYGNPHAESQGTYTIEDGKESFSDGFHTFTCDWEPGKIDVYKRQVWASVVPSAAPAAPRWRTPINT